ncbi:hypothetical protein PpBr36_01117 [Pyricularia pennisetigena]|uniref:hypothetical protein n=1 Tax=Pyricularia pennisetigena TaxID=1578925 RepID=UPI001152EBD1|nr:hypothetical protein PpBr36_01117 [Pyricularia pennisetigena]TLS29506.1 hypothetical protein PpBr36_01117 [Pyricularia pennisetigena]
MSTASTRSWKPSRRLQSIQDGERRARASSRASQGPLPPNEVYSYALRVAYLNYLLQPKKKRKEYVKLSRPQSRIHASGVGDLIREFTGTTSSGNVKLPHSFRHSLEKRMEGVLTGSERMPGYSDAAVKRTFGEAYTAFTAQDFRRSVDKDRKLEPLILIFYSSANRAQARATTPEDQSWRVLVDRHLSLFVRLVVAVLRDHGSDRDRPELMNRLATLEKKLINNDKDLYLDTGQDAQHKTIEVEIPLTHDVKDMPMVQFVANVFARDLATVQADINSNRSLWTAENGVRDFKAYQQRMNASMNGALRRQDFDVDDAYEEWKKAEGKLLAAMISDVINARPDLAGSASTSAEKPLPTRPQSYYNEDQAFADLGRLVTSPDSASAPFSFDGSPSLGSLSLDDSSSIRSVDEPSYTFIPPDPRHCYKQVLQLTTLHDLLHPDPSAPCSLLSVQSETFLAELALRWRLPQHTRHITFMEVVGQHFLEQQVSIEELTMAFEFAKETAPEVKRPPHIMFYTDPLMHIPRSQWSIPDTSAYRTLLHSLNDALLRDMLELLSKCYEDKPPSFAKPLMFIMNNIHSDEAFSQRQEDADEYAEALSAALRKNAAAVYRSYLDAELPESQEDWDFSHVVKLGQSVVALCERVQKKFRKHPVILGASPFGVLVETMFPTFEEDAKAIVERILAVHTERKEEVHVQDGFDLYKELVEIRKIHVKALPSKPFFFSIEDLLQGFVWRWIQSAEERLQEFVEQAVKQDQFQVKTRNPDGIASDNERHSVSILDIFAMFNQTVDQVFQLGWDDDVHHARFMTALAKGFAAGIGRYCEIVDQRFSREMDRASAQDAAAAASKTTQERFMQYAKDALSTKEKAEPFQFYPESFVKLNNIEYAMQALDKLEKLVNADGCADVLLKADGPIRMFQKTSRYTFTIKIVEAEDLKACDPTGTSDPYVVLCDEYQKRLAKTRIVMRNLNPRWDESVDIEVHGPLNLIATIWDYDTFGDHDFVGRTSLKLDPKHFSDYLPREFWLDLDTQGRLLIRVSMEGERDDIQFYFAKAFRHLKRTERDMVRKVTDKLVTHINASLSHDALKSLLNRGIASSVASLWQKRTARLPPLTQADIENALKPLFDYFNDNFAVMKQTLTDATMLAVMTRLWKEVLMAIENLLVPPLSDKPSSQKPLTQTELDVVYKWLELLFEFFNAADEHGVAMGVPAEILKSPKWHELASLNFFYFEDTAALIRTSEGIAKATAQRAQQQLHSANTSNRMSAPASLSAAAAAPAFASMGTIRRGKSIMMSRNLGTMRKAKEEKRKEAQADPSDDMILRILRMRPEAAQYLKERHRQKERLMAHAAAAAIVQKSVHQGWNGGPAFGGAHLLQNKQSAAVKIPSLRTAQIARHLSSSASTTSSANMASQYTVRKVAAPNTLEHRVYIEKDGVPVSPFHDIPLYANAEQTILNMVVEIPRWTNAKLEISKDELLNPIKQDIKKGKLRYVRNCFPHKGYLWNYGAFPQTWEDPNAVHPETKAKGDNDPLDVCEIGELVGYTGQVKQVKVLGVMALLDEEETDWKVIVIDVNDPLASKLNDVEDVERHLPGLLRATNEWFRIYKIPDGKPENQFAFTGECKNKKYAMDVIRECAEAWEKLITGKTQPGDVSTTNLSVSQSPSRVSAEQLPPLPPHEELPPAKIDASIDKWFFISGASA